MPLGLKYWRYPHTRINSKQDRNACKSIYYNNITLQSIRWIYEHRQTNKCCYQPTIYEVNNTNKARLAFCTRKRSLELRQFFSRPCVNFGSLVANAITEIFLNFIELILVRVFLDGYLRVIGRERVSRGSKWYEYCHGYEQCFATGKLLLRAKWRNGDFSFEVQKMWQLRLV